MPKRIDPELRARAVRLVSEHRAEYPTETAAVIAVAKQLGVSRESVRRWQAQAGVDAGDRPGVTTQDNAADRRHSSVTELGFPCRLPVWSKIDSIGSVVVARCG